MSLSLKIQKKCSRFISSLEANIITFLEEENIKYNEDDLKSELNNFLNELNLITDKYSHKIVEKVKGEDFTLKDIDSNIRLKRLDSAPLTDQALVTTNGDFVDFDEE